jgi:2-keto-4-pentenoate hydratase
MTDLARRLWQARRSGGVVDLDDVRQPKSGQEAYAIQHEIAALCGEPARGFKVGSTSLEAQRLLGTDEPGSGLLLAPYVYESPARISIEPAHTPAVEGEFAFRLDRDLPPRAAPYAIDEIADVAAVAGAIEVVGTRFAGGLAGKGRWLVTADCGANIAFVGGPWRHDWRRLDLKTHPVAMTINGAVRGTGTGERALGDPMNVLLWLQQSAAGRGLKAGEIVSTGTCTGLDPVRPGDRVQADFGDLGVVEIVIE